MKLSKRVTKRFAAPGDDSAFIAIRHLRLSELRAIEAAANKVTFQSSGDETHTQIELNPYLRSKEITSACLVDWGGFFDTLERPIPFSEKNIEKMADFEFLVDGKYQDFYAWVASCHDALDEEVRANSEEAEKN